MKLLRLVVLWVVVVGATGLIVTIANLALPHEIFYPLLVIAIVALHEWRRKMAQNR